MKFDFSSQINYHNFVKFGFEGRYSDFKHRLSSHWYQHTGSHSTFYWDKYHELSDKKGWTESAIDKKAIQYADYMSVKTKPTAEKIQRSRLLASRNEWLKFANMYRNWKETQYNWWVRKTGEYKEGHLSLAKYIYAALMVGGAIPAVNNVISKRGKTTVGNSIEKMVLDGTGNFLIVDQAASSAVFTKKLYSDADLQKTYSKAKSGKIGEAIYEMLYAYGYAKGTAGIKPAKKTLDIFIKGK